MQVSLGFVNEEQRAGLCRQDVCSDKNSVALTVRHLSYCVGRLAVTMSSELVTRFERQPHWEVGESKRLVNLPKRGNFFS